MNTNDVQLMFYALIRKFTNKEEFLLSLWEELFRQYNSPRRYYHNLNHISELLFYFTEYKGVIKNPEVLLFAIFYHDIIYDVLKKDNEEKSAVLAKKRMSQLKISEQDIDLCYNYILATKNHHAQIQNSDLAYFLDFDMAVVGKSAEEYLNYTHQIRKEYALFPDFMYRKGRKKVLKSFLQKERIFISDTFYSLFEKQARKNIYNELITL
jgi:predicted metal-dependent HD superfamily phosphohydrolase